MSPALCSLLLQRPKERKEGFWYKVNTSISNIIHRYSIVVSIIAKKIPIIAIIFAGLLILAVVLFNMSQTSFIPEEDQGVAVMSVQLPEGANKKKTADFMDRIREVLKTEPSIEGVSDVIGYNMIDGRGENVAMSFIVLRPWGERKDPSQHSTAIVNRLRQKLASFT